MPTSHYQSAQTSQNPVDSFVLLKILGPNLFGPHFSVSLSNQTVWPVIFGLTGPICARALKSLHLLGLRLRGHHGQLSRPSGIRLDCGVFRRRWCAFSCTA